MKDDLQDYIGQVVRGLLSEAGDDESLPDFALAPPRQAEHGDFACNAAMLLAKRLARPPREIAESLVDRLGDAGGLLERAEVAGPGFVNLWLGGGQWQGLLRAILEQGDRYGRCDLGGGAPVQVEFVSANPTGPLSTGHGRRGVLGDCIAACWPSRATR